MGLDTLRSPAYEKGNPIYAADGRELEKLDFARFQCARCRHRCAVPVEVLMKELVAPRMY